MNLGGWIGEWVGGWVHVTSHAFDVLRWLRGGRNIWYRVRSFIYRIDSWYIRDWVVHVCTYLDVCTLCTTNVTVISMNRVWRFIRTNMDPGITQLIPQGCKLLPHVCTYPHTHPA